MSSAAKEFEGFARDCVRLAEGADTPELREKLLNLAREWMRAVMEAEDSDCAADRRPVATTRRRDPAESARPPSPHHGRHTHGCERIAHPPDRVGRP